MNLKQKFSHYRLICGFGLFLVILAEIIWFVSLIEIFGNEIMLSRADSLGLGLEEIWAYEGALKWWNFIYGSLVVPLSIILVISGFAIMFHRRLISFTKNVISNYFRTNFKSKTTRVDQKKLLINEAQVILKTLATKEYLIEEEKERLFNIRKKWEEKIQQDINLREDSIQKLRIEINDLKYIHEELNRQSRLPKYIK
jgi:hypothetical protein